MKLNKFFRIFFVAAILAQTFSINAFAFETYSVSTGGPIPPCRLKKENMVLTRTYCDLAAETAKPCDIVKLNVLEDIDCGNKVLIPCGSVLEGKIVKVQRALILRTDAYIDIAITNIKTSSGCDINLAQNPIQLRIVDPHYKTLGRKIAQRGPVVVTNGAVSIALTAATNLSGGVIFAITTGAAMAVGAVSGFLDPDIDKTRVDGAIVRGVEASALGTFIITVERGYDIDSPACCYVVVRIDDDDKQKIVCSLQNSIAQSTVP